MKGLLLRVGIGIMLTMAVFGLQGQESRLQFNFVRQNNFTFATRMDMRLIRNFNKYSFDLKAHHDNLLNTSGNNSPFIQVIFQTELWQRFRLSKSLALASLIEADQFIHTGTQRYSVYGGLTWKKSPALEITPLLGYSWDYLTGILDQGLSPALYLRSRYDFGDGLRMRTRLYARAKYIRPRHQRNLLFVSDWTKRFNTRATINFGVHAGSNEMDTYRTQSVEKISSDSLDGYLGWRYRLNKFLEWDSYNRGGIQVRKFNYQTLEGSETEFNNLAFNQIQILTRQRLSYGRKKWSGYYQYEYQHLNRSYRVENNTKLSESEYDKLKDQETLKDYTRNEFNMELSMRYQPVKRHSILAIASNRYLQYDTPSETNTDDHDELNYGLTLEWRGAWSRRFSTTYRVIGRIRKYAFLFASRSQENYTQRNLRMDFEFDWVISDRLVLRGQQYLYVNYNVKDFGDSNFTDRSIRNLESRVELSYRHNRRLQSTLSIYRKEIQVAYLNWEKFSETPIDTTITFIIEQMNSYEMKLKLSGWSLSLNAGYKHVSILQNFNTTMTDPDNQLTPINLHISSHQTGPVTGFRFRGKNQSYVDFSLWWQFQFQQFSFMKNDGFTSISGNYLWSRLQNTPLILRPYVRVSMNFFLGIAQI